jgi:hypothetical protein
MEKTFSEKMDSFVNELIAEGIQEKKPDDVNEIICLKHEVLEGRTIFDDYFLAVLEGVSGAAACPVPKGIGYEEIPEALVNFAYEVVKAAMRKREEHFSGEKHERS